MRRPRKPKLPRSLPGTLAWPLNDAPAMPRPIPATPADIGDGEDRLVDVHSPEVPPGIRAGVLRLMQPGDQLWRCPRLGAPRGLLGVLGVGPRDVVIEWWLMDAQGGLIEAFWEEG